LNFAVIFLDYGCPRAVWHPAILFDRVLASLTFIALMFFVFGAKSISAAAEWVILLFMVCNHGLLPVRGARIVLSRPQIWYNSFRSRVNDNAHEVVRASPVRPEVVDTVQQQKPKETQIESVKVPRKSSQVRA
jgi:hypothetical protein